MALHQSNRFSRRDTKIGGMIAHAGRASKESAMRNSDRAEHETGSTVIDEVNISWENGNDVVSDGSPD